MIESRADNIVIFFPHFDQCLDSSRALIFLREFFSYLSLIAFAMINRGHFLSVVCLFVKFPYFCKYLSRETCISSR